MNRKDDKSRAAQSITRRSFIKQAAAGTAVLATASVGPWFIKDALSTSGELKLFTWPDYSKPEVISAFEKDTGIKVKVTNYSTNQECMNKLRAARATGFDVAQPSLTEFELHMEFDLYREIDENKISNLSNLEPAFYEKSKELGGVIRGKRVGLVLTGAFVTRRELVEKHTSYLAAARAARRGTRSASAAPLRPMMMPGRPERMLTRSFDAVRSMSTALTAAFSSRSRSS